MAAAEVETKSVIIRTHDDQRIKLRCPVCGSETWAQGEGAEGIEGFEPVLVANSANRGMVSMSIIQLFCGNCGYSVQFGQVENVAIEVA